MNTDGDDGFDAHCVNCGAGYHFDVGFTLSICPACGRSQTETLSEQAERAEREREFARRYDAGDVQRESMLAALAEYASQFAMLERTPDALTLSRAVRELATATLRASLKGHQP